MSFIEKIKKNQSKGEWVMTIIALIILGFIYIVLWYFSTFKGGGCTGCL